MVAFQITFPFLTPALPISTAAVPPPAPFENPLETPPENAAPPFASEARPVLEVASPARWRRQMAATFHRLTALCIDGERRIRALREGDLEGFRAVVDDFRRESAMLLGRFSTPSKEMRLSEMAGEFRRSADAAVQHFLTNVGLQQTSLEHRILSWEEAMANMASQSRRTKVELVAREGYTIDPAREMAANILIGWLQNRALKGSGRWEEGMWVVQVPKKRAVNAYTSSLVGMEGVWPPDPVRDPVLRTYLAVLGWRMQVEDAGGTVLVRLRFDRVTQSIGEPVALSVRLLEDVYDLCVACEIESSEAGDIRTLRRIRQDFDRESSRMLDLFPPEKGSPDIVLLRELHWLAVRATAALREYMAAKSGGRRQDYGSITSVVEVQSGFVTGFRIDRFRWTLAHPLLAWLDHHLRPGFFPHWEKNVWTARLTRPGIPYERITALRSLRVPIHRRRHRALETYLKILKWRLEVQDAADGSGDQIVRISV